MEEAVKQSPVIQEKITKVLVNSENTMSMGNIDQFKGHSGSALHGIKVSTGRAETAVAAERNEFELATVRTAIHGTAKGGISAVNHFIHVFDDGSTWM